ncbi:MarR family winged helix-turn-helix transcriptional regulator [Blastococcus sp. URHD0036]|uniref:MarR family winged helix-turn-helix transcriptional regulator n=1 Tax=Blastococcus sp. URHD0036 TaxID=1380356 RepID=UPI000495E2E5|nr:MarR family transcriptional regulator [Blastococcus sp. URHD0036]
MDTSDNVLWLLIQAHRSGRRWVDDAVRSHGVTAAQVGVLNRLAEQPGLSGAELARSSLISPQASSLVLETLERRGLVERRPDPAHGRILRNHLTAEGRRLAAASIAAAVAGEAELLAVLDDDERATLRRLLERLVARTPPGDRERSGA